MAQAGLWDVDGNGMSKIDDPNLARAFVKKVNDFNISSTAQAVALMGVFAALPRSFTGPFAFFAILFTGLYFLEGKLQFDEEN
jgi:hypothetical protein